MIERRRYTSGQIAVANLSASIEGLERPRTEPARFEDLLALSELLFARGDLLGRISDHDRAERVALEAAASSPDGASALHVRARLALRFRRFGEADMLLDASLAAGHPPMEVAAGRAEMLQATGRFAEALPLRERLAEEDRGIRTLGALASLLAETGRFPEAADLYTAALESDEGTSPLPCGQLLFEWGVHAMRCGLLERAEALLGELGAILPAHAPGRGRRAELALACGRLDEALALVAPLLDLSDDPGYRATYAEILAARGERAAAAREAELAATVYERLVARRPEAYADRAAAFFRGIGNRPQRAADLSSHDGWLREPRRARDLRATARCGGEAVA